MKPRNSLVRCWAAITGATLALAGGYTEASIVAAPTNSSAAGLRPGEDTPILRAVLDPLKVVRVAVATDRVTTFRFPSAIAALESFQVGTDPEAGAAFLLTFHSGEAFFSVRALREGASTSLNVVWDRRTFVLELVHSVSPQLSVIFESAGEPKASGPPASVTPHQLLAKLDLAKAYALLRQQHPSAVAGVEVARPNTTQRFLGHSVVIEEIFRFNAEDLLVFRIVINNHFGAPMNYEPGSIMVRVGGRVYYQAITDASGVVPGNESVPVYFAIRGSADGSRADLSLKNDFMVLFAHAPRAVIPAGAAPVAATPPDVSGEGPRPPVIRRRTRSSASP